MKRIQSSVQEMPTPYHGVPGLMMVATIILAVTGIWGSTLYAQVGSSSVPFLNIEPDARSSGLGNTGVSRAGSAHGAFWNPALLGFQEQAWFSVSHSNWLPALGNRYSHEHMSITNVLGDRHAISAHLTYLNLGSQLATDDIGNELGQFGNFELAAGLSYGIRLGNRWSVGSGLRYIHSNIGVGQFSDGKSIQAGKSFSGDLGAYWQGAEFRQGGSTGQIRWGMALTNFGPGIAYLEGQHPQALPANFRTGLSYELRVSGENKHRFIASFDINKDLSRMDERINGNDTTYSSMSSFRSLWEGWRSVRVVNGDQLSTLDISKQLTYGAGFEYWFHNTLALRLGYLYEHPLHGNRDFLTLGTGLRYGRLGVDFSYLYATNDDHPLANTLRITAKIAFNSINVKKTTPAPIPFLQPIHTPDYVVAADLVTANEDEQVASDIIAVAEPIIEDPVVPVMELGFEAPLVQFESMSSIIREEYSPLLDSIATFIEHRASDLRLHIVGHTDVIGTQAINTMLSESRARAVALALIDRGLSPSHLSIQWVSDNQPLQSNSNREARAMNRRVHFEVGESLPYGGSLGTNFSSDDKIIDLWNPVYRRNELQFNFIDLLDATSHSNRFWAIAMVLKNNPSMQVYIGTRVNFNGSGREFMMELEKARSEKIRYALLVAGADPNRVHVLQAGSEKWQQHLQPWLLMRLVEQTVVILSEE
jgi:outer membrane protein OmpA-like peptidoglycan-associated protein